MQPRFLRVYLKLEHAAVGKRLREMELHLLNVEVNAVRRPGVRDAQTSDEILLQAGDVLVLLGLPDALSQAELRLKGS
jgi:CPA2 family monovalent cation:H+ antiporter-2